MRKRPSITLLGLIGGRATIEVSSDLEKM